MEGAKSFDLEKQVLASPSIRYVGQFLDVLTSAGVFLATIWLCELLAVEKQIASIVAFALAVLYFLFSDGLPKGQSVGKKLLGISVVSSQTGESCNLLQSFFRNFLTPILGWMDAIFILRDKRQRIGDKLAHTIVVVN